jgi:large conductance mechanosensitive channel
MIKEFREFILRGNVLDMAVGIIIGTAFGAITASLVADVLMPPIGLLLARVDFGGWAVTLKEAEGTRPAVVMSVGKFVNVLINFLIVAAAVFLLVKGANWLHRKPAPPPPDTRDCPDCLSRIPLKAKRCRHCTSAVTPAA